MKTTIFLLAAALTFSIPFAAADETHPDCETGNDYGEPVHPRPNELPEGQEPNSPDRGEHDQAFIGYTSTEGVYTTYTQLGRPGGLFVCEGEHWDGQDSVSDEDAGTSDCLTNVVVHAEGVAWCTESDINQGEADPTDGATPAATRVSTSGNEVYAGTNLVVPGRAAVYASGDGVVAVYLRDNMPGNVLAGVVSAAGITKGFPSDGDCDQETYEAGAYDQNPDTARTWCGRDNTAITVYVLS